VANENKNHANDSTSSGGTSRRGFLSQVTLAGAGLTLAPLLGNANNTGSSSPVPAAVEVSTVRLTINGKEHILQLDSRVTLLDALRERLAMPGTKKGCDHGQCGACTVLINGRRSNSCLTFASMCEGDEIVTIEGLANGEKLHPMQEAFIKHDAFQCGYCTPGQICSAVGLVKEGHAKTDAEISESMSGNICRCGAYRNIVSAIKEVQTNQA
jgi:xanthine dehydrogenase YagT iron-sulfur-binding subunit